MLPTAYRFDRGQQHRSRPGGARIVRARLEGAGQRPVIAHVSDIEPRRAVPLAVRLRREAGTCIVRGVRMAVEVHGELVGGAKLEGGHWPPNQQASGVDEDDRSQQSRRAPEFRVHRLRPRRSRARPPDPPDHEGQQNRGQQCEVLSQRQQRQRIEHGAERCGRDVGRRMHERRGDRRAAGNEHGRHGDDCCCADDRRQERRPQDARHAKSSRSTVRSARRPRTTSLDEWGAAQRCARGGSRSRRATRQRGLSALGHAEGARETLSS